MALNVGQMVIELRRMTVTELRRKHTDVFGEQTRSHHKDYLIRRIARRVQANAEGGLPERARRRALEIADDADLRTRAPAARIKTSVMPTYAREPDSIAPDPHRARRPDASSSAHGRRRRSPGPA